MDGIVTVIVPCNCLILVTEQNGNERKNIETGKTFVAVHSPTVTEFCCYCTKINSHKTMLSLYTVKQPQKSVVTIHM